jgi:hypothetical protein
MTARMLHHFTLRRAGGRPRSAVAERLGRGMSWMLKFMLFAGRESTDFGRR